MTETVGHRVVREWDGERPAISDDDVESWESTLNDLVKRIDAAFAGQPSDARLTRVVERATAIYQRTRLEVSRSDGDPDYVDAWVRAYHEAKLGEKVHDGFVDLAGGA